MKINKNLLKYWNDKKFIRQNIIAWLIIYAVAILWINGGAESEPLTIWRPTKLVLMLSSVFYVNFFLLVVYFQKSKLKYALFSLLFFSLYFGYIYYNLTVLNPLPDDKQRFGLFVIFTIFYILLYSISVVYFSSKDSSISKKENEKNRLILENTNLELQQQNLLLQNQLLATEVKFLRAQINPHFLFNCLNFFYSGMLEKEPELADGVMTLSQIMRYSLQDFSRNGGMANLEDEIEHIKNTIKIHQMRFDDSLNIKLEVMDNTSDIQIIPMVLITLTENVFKHGNLKNPHAPAMIKCQISKEKKAILFSTANLKKQGETFTHSPGSEIGLANIRQRLEQLYKNDFLLKVIDDEDWYQVELEFPYFKNEHSDNNVSNISTISA